MKKSLSFLLVIALAFTMIPFGMISAFAETVEGWDFYTVREYNQEKAPDVTDTTMFAYSSLAALPEREFTRDYAVAADEWALKLTKKAGTAANTGDNIWFVNFVNQEYSAEAAGMRIWVANPANTTVNLRWNYNAIYSGIDRTYPISSGKAYYLQSANDGAVYSRTTAAYNNDHGLISIPSGFIGWLYIPFNDYSYEYNRIRMFINATAEDADTTVYVSRMEYYSTTAVTPLTNLDLTFDSMLAIANMSGSNTTLTTEYRDGDSGQSLKITDASGSYNFYGLCGRLASDTESGIKFWVKNPQSASIKLMVMVTDNYANINTNSTFYLQPENGDPYTGRTVSAHESGRAAIVIPADFTGYVYIPYTAHSTNLKKGHFILNFGDSTAKGATAYIDSFGNYDFADFDVYNFITFDGIDDPSTYMWDYSGISEVSTEKTDGSVGKSIKTTLKTDTVTHNRIRSFMPSYTDAAVYNNSFGYRVWVSNPNDYAIYAFPQFTENCRRALVGKEYYLVTEKGVTGHKLKALYSGDTALGCVTLPAGFEGYIYIPKTSIFENDKIDFTTGNAIQFRLNYLAVKETGIVYLDSFGLYNTASELTAADLNGDSKVDILDLIRMKKYAADSTTFINDLVLDIDENGTIDTAVDMVVLRKTLLGV